MKKLILTAAILVGVVTIAHARDAYVEAAAVMFYEKNCSKLPADFVKAKIKEATGGATAAARRYSADALKDALDSEQKSFESSKSSMKEYCGYQELDIKCMLYGYRHGG